MKDRTLKVHENGKIYKVMLRPWYQASIRTEKKLREVVDRSIKNVYGEKAVAKPLFEKMSILGIYTQKWVIDEKGRIIK